MGCAGDRRRVGACSMNGLVRQHGERNGFKGLALPSGILQSLDGARTEDGDEMRHERKVERTSASDEHFVNGPTKPTPCAADGHCSKECCGRQQIFWRKRVAR